MAGKWVYIDGGESSYKRVDENTTLLYCSFSLERRYFSTLTCFHSAKSLLSIDLSQNWTNATVTINSNDKPVGVPNLNNPSFWYHEQEDIFYSGFSGWNSNFQDKPPLPPPSLWTFQPDGTGSGIWSEIIESNSSVWNFLIRRIYPIMAHGPDSAFILGGTDNGRIFPYSADLLAGMVQFNMSSRSFTNSSSSSYDAVFGVDKGAMQYVPSFGPKGFFVVMGGENGNWTGHVGLIDFGTVSVYDPEKQEWWNQSTTGNWPTPRIDFCTAGVSSTNESFDM